MRLSRLSAFLFFLTFLLFSVQSFSQTGEIRGFVFNKETGEPIIFTNVYFQSTTIGDATDLEGFYDISKVKPGKYIMVCTYMGYDSFKKEVTLKKNDIINFNIYLTPGAIQLKEVKISDTKTTRQTQVKVSKIKITPNDIKRLPAIGATPDLAQYIQVLPGVVTTGDKGGQIYIRGGTPVQNKVIIDGMTIYNPFHSIGLYSVFDIDIIKNIDVYAGGFDAEYGDRISAIMDISTVDGNKKRLSGKVGISPFTSKLLLTGPLKKFKENSGSSTFLFSARNAYLDKTGPVLYSYADSNGLPYSFTDLYGKLSFVSSEGSKIEFFGFHFNDLVNFENITSYHWNSSGFGTQFLLIPQASSTIVEGRFSFSGYRINQEQPDNKPRYSSIKGFEGGMTFSYYLGKDLFRYGFELSGLQTQYEFYNASNRRIGGSDEAQSTTNIAGFMKYKKIFGDKLILVPSIRLQHYGDLQETSLEPRFGMKYNFTENFRFKLASGLYSQNFISAFSDRDVVNYFYGFLLAPSYIPTDFNGQKVASRLQKSQHLIAGFEYDLAEHSLLNIEAYFKNYSILTNINRNKIFDDNEDFQDEPDYLKSDFIVEKGTAYGLNIHYIYEMSPFYFWVVYDLAFVDRYYIDKTGSLAKYLPNWDRRHNVQLLGNYSTGGKNPFEVSVRWNFGSGFPFTQTQGFFEYLDFGKGLDEDYTTTNGRLEVLYADEINGGRLPYYHRLDVSAKKTYNFSSAQKLELVLSIVNVYNRSNIFYYDRFNNATVYQLPVLPSLGATYSF